ncbi:MAG: flavin-containing monooxygenase [Myxococcota bacterium]
MDEKHFEVLIVGAGISGIGAAWHLQNKCPGKSYAILEARHALGGTWDLFRYPGIRSDSDMHTLGFSFRPWMDSQSIVDGPSILEYLRSTAEDAGIDRKIRYGLRVEHASWSTREGRWTVEARDVESGERVVHTCSFLWMCSGYYRYDRGYTPSFPGTDRFRGRIVHPQRWTEEVSYEGQRVVVIGSGATAVTLVPELAKKAAHVTMLQRSPSYVLSRPREDRISEWLEARLPPKPAYALTRWKNVLLGLLFYRISRRYPKRVKRAIVDQVRRALGRDFDVETHFTPRYDPWDQRVCLVPDGDLFEAIRSGRVDVVTDHIDTFTERGIRLRSGHEIEADLIVTATGLQMQLLGGATMEVDGEHVEPSRLMMYKGTMFSDVPNAAVCLGYTNASWTLKCELSAEYVCRLLNHMDARGYSQCCPRNRDDSVEPRPLIDLTSGYVQRAIDQLPSQGSRRPWRLHQNYVIDRQLLRRGPIEDGVIELTRPAKRAPEAESELRGAAGSGWRSPPGCGSPGPQ